MNHQDYLEYEGTRLLSYSLSTYSRGACGELAGDLLRALEKDHKDVSAEEREALLALSWEYVIFRLYVASSIIGGWKGCFGCQRAILEGLEETLISIPETLKLLALEKELSGSYLVLGRHVPALTKDHVEAMFAAYKEIDSAAARDGAGDRLTVSIENSLSRMAGKVSAPLSPSMILYLTEETKAFMNALRRRLSTLTPEKLHQKAHKKTVLHTYGSVFSRETYDHLYPSFTVAATMAAGFLFMFA